MTTEAGRRLLDRWQETGEWPPSPAPKGGWTPPRLVAAIEAEARAAALREVAERVRALPWNVAGQATAPVGGCDEEWAVGEYQSAVLSILTEATGGGSSAMPGPFEMLVLACERADVAGLLPEEPAAALAVIHGLVPSPGTRTAEIVAILTEATGASEQ